MASKFIPKTVTDTSLRALLKPDDDRVEDGKEPLGEFDFKVPGQAGMYVRREVSGVVTFRYRAVLASGERPWIIIGRFPTVSLSEAKDLRRDMEKEVEQGLDPRLERRRRERELVAGQNKERDRQARTVRHLIATWGWYYARKSRVEAREPVRLLKVNLEPWLTRPAEDVTEEDAVKLLDKVKARGSNVMANRICSLAKQMFEFCIVDRKIIRSNPFRGIVQPGGDEHPIERALAFSEIRTVWSTLIAPDSVVGKQMSLALRLLLITGQRTKELRESRRSHFDLENKVWTIPPKLIKKLGKRERGMTSLTRAQRRKNRRRQDELPREHVIPLTDLAVMLIRQLIALNPNPETNDHLLPTYRRRARGNKPIEEKALARALSRHIVEHTDGRFTLFGLSPFTPQDLRRTCATGLTTLGIDVKIAGMLLNHSDPKRKQDASTTEKVYDKYAYLDEKRAAMEAWSQALMQIIAGQDPKRSKAA